MDTTELERLVAVSEQTECATHQPWRTFRPDESWKGDGIPGQPYGWIQWKGTGVCMDVWCACGELVHLDAEFAYTIRCGSCGRWYEVSGYVELRLITDDVATDHDPDKAKVAT